MCRYDNLAVQEVHRENAERMLLASFVAGLLGEIGKMRIQNPQNVNQALTTALTIREALRQEKDAETFFTKFENSVEVSSRGRVGHVQGRAEPKCYECEGHGHCMRMPHTFKKGANTELAWEEKPEQTFKLSTLARNESRYLKGGGGDMRVSVQMERGSPAILVEIEGGTKRLIIDTGSSVSILQPAVSRRGIWVTAIKPYGVTGENLNIQGQQCVSFVLGGKTFRHTFLVCPLLTKADGLLSSDLRKVGAVINFDSRELLLGGSNKAPHERVTRSSEHAVLTVFPEEKLEADKPLQTRREERNPSGHKLDNPLLDKSARSSKSRLIKAAEEVVTAPKCRRVVTPKYNGKKKIPSLVGTEPTGVPIQGVFTAPAILRTGTVARDMARLTLQPTQAKNNKPAKSAHIRFCKLKPDSYVSKKENSYDDTSVRNKRQKSNRRSHEANKHRYDRCAKICNFKKGDYVYLYNPAMKPGPLNNFYFPWSGPFRVTDKLSDLNYKLLGHHERKFIIHVHRLKLCQGTVNQKPNPVPKWRRKTKHRGDDLSGMNHETDLPVSHFILFIGQR
jgi:hypothetical protein